MWYTHPSSPTRKVVRVDTHLSLRKEVHVYLVFGKGTIPSTNKIKFAAILYRHRLHRRYRS